MLLQVFLAVRVVTNALTNLGQFQECLLLLKLRGLDREGVEDIISGKAFEYCLWQLQGGRNAGLE